MRRRKSREEEGERQRGKSRKEGYEAEEKTEKEIFE